MSQPARAASASLSYSTTMTDQDRQDLQAALERLDALYQRSSYSEVRVARDHITAVLERNPKPEPCKRCGLPFGGGLAHGLGFCLDRPNPLKTE